MLTLLVWQSIAAEAATLDWSTRPTTNLIAGSDTANVSSVSITSSGATSGTFDTRLIQIQPSGSSNGYIGYIISQMDAANDNGTSIQTTTISFSSPVYNLSFTVFDIDGGPAFNDGTNAWNDIVDFSSDAGVPTSVMTAANVSYNATTGRASATANANLTDATGNVTVTYAGPVNSVTRKPIAGAVPGTNNPTNQYVFIDDLTFTASQPTVSIQKISTGGTGTFSFSATNLSSSPGSISTFTSGTATPATPTSIGVVSTGVAVTITETSLPSGYTLTGAQCTDANATITGNSGSFGSVSGNTVTIPASAIVSFADINCIFTNTRAVVRVAKISEGGTGTFSFSDSNLQGSINAITTTSADTSTPSPNSPRNISNLNNPVSISETVASGFALTSASCVDANAAITGNTGTIGTLSGNTLTIPTANIKAGADFTCTFTNTRATVRVSKVTLGNAGGPFTFSATNLASTPASITTVTSGVSAPVSPTAINVTTIGQAVTITETVASGYAISGASCTDTNSSVTGNTGSFGTLSGSTLTIPASRVVAGAKFDCTFTNARIPTVSVQKTTEGGFGGPFSFSQTNLASTPSAITTTAIATATPASPAAINVTTTGAAVTLTETVASGYRITAASCTDANSAITGNTGTIGTLSGSTLTIPVAAVVNGAEFRCTFTNALIPTVAVRKTTLGAAGGPFTFSQTNLASAPSAITTSAPSTATPSSPTAINVTTIGTAVTITETLASGFAISAASCTDTNSAVTGNTGSFGTLSGSTLTIPASRVVAGARFDCTFTNRRIPTVSLQKITSGGAGGPFSFSATNLASAPANITTTIAGTAAPASPTAIQVTTNGTDVTLTETVAGGYFISGGSCTDANAAITGNAGAIGSLSGSTFTIPGSAVVDGADFRCTFTNTLAVPQLSVAKSASVASINAAGNTIGYTVTVTNTGNVTITGITVSDPLGTLTCTTSGNATIASLAPSAQETCSFTYTVTQAVLDSNGGGDGDIDNTATAEGSYGAVTVQASGSTAVALVINPQLSITKTADDDTDVVAGQTITYTYVVTNTGNQTIADIGLSDSHNGSGPAPVPGSETLSTDAGPAGDSTDATAGNGVWSSLAPGDAVTFTATYIVTQQDVDTRQ